MVGVRLKAELPTASWDVGPPRGEPQTPNSEPRTPNSKLQTPPHYSVRSAVSGLIRVARRAGSQQAKSVAAASTRGATVNAIGSSAPT